MKSILSMLLTAALVMGAFSSYAKEKESNLPAEKDFSDETEDPFFDAVSNYTIKTALEIFEEETGKNTVYSPANLYMALCMLCELCDNASRDQLLELLELDSVEETREIANSLYQFLTRDDPMGTTLPGNSFWLNECYEVKPEVLSILDANYQAAGYTVPMGTKETNEAIQNWINEQTHDLLKDAASKLETSPETLLLLVSTLYFKDNWSSAFAAENNTQDVFTNADASEIETEFMHRWAQHSTCYREEEKGYTIASLSFNSGLAMNFLLPDENRNLNEVMDEESLRNLLNWQNMDECTVANVNWSVPKFDINSDLDLVKTLSKLGVNDIFHAETADFSPLTDLEGVEVSEIQHAGRVKIDEEGCEAAAFTAINMKAAGFFMEECPEVEMNLNRPFVFLITGADGLPLFMGTVNTMD